MATGVAASALARARSRIGKSKSQRGFVFRPRSRGAHGGPLLRGTIRTRRRRRLLLHRRRNRPATAGAPLDAAARPPALGRGPCGRRLDARRPARPRARHNLLRIGARRPPRLGRAPFPALCDLPPPGTSPSSQLCHAVRAARVDDEPGGHAPAAAPANAGTRARRGLSWRTLLGPPPLRGRRPLRTQCPRARRLERPGARAALRSLKEQVAPHEAGVEASAAEPPPPADVPAAPRRVLDGPHGRGRRRAGHAARRPVRRARVLPRGTRRSTSPTQLDPRVRQRHRRPRLPAQRDADPGDDPPRRHALLHAFTSSSARPTPCRARARDALDASAVRIASSK